MSTGPVADYLADLHARYADDDAGAVADYIPELAGVSPDLFGIVLVTVDGAVYEAGDTGHEFTIQSISKAFTFAMALDELGADRVRDHIGVEPTGDAFNSISLHPVTGVPLNPMVNAGAITASGLVAGSRPDDAEAHVLDTYASFAGRRLRVDEAVRASEDATGYRNRAIAHLLRGSGALVVEPEVALDLYFRQCSVAVDTRDLAMMAATLANGGVNPLTGVQAAGRATTRNVLTVMASCGMYNGAGEWLYTVGLPAKSGVGGGIIAVLPGQFGLAVFSPPLDEHGNSARGVRVCRDLSRELDLHLVRSGHRGASAIRTCYTLAQGGSTRQRGDRSRQELLRNGHQAIVVELQGDLEFQAGELVVRRLVEASDDPRYAIVDLRRVDRVHDAPASLLAGLLPLFHARGGALVISGAQDHPELLAGLIARALALGIPSPGVFDDLDLALEWCEDQLLVECAPDLATTRIELRDHELLRGLTEDQLNRVEAFLLRRNYEAGSVVLHQGDPATEVLLITAGHLSLYVEHGDGRRHRMTTLSAGRLAGEMALTTGERRRATLEADTDVECYVVPADVIAKLPGADPAVRAVLLANLVGILARHADRAHRDLMVIMS